MVIIAKGFFFILTNITCYHISFTSIFLIRVIFKQRNTHSCGKSICINLLELIKIDSSSLKTENHMRDVFGKSLIFFVRI